MDISNLSRRTQWIILALASGACAAFNGVFAKLTTTELTTSFAMAIARVLGFGEGEGEKIVEVIIRAMFFGLNLIFNGIMWALFTKALARGTSTTQVSILNTSSNFMITAVLGFIIFSESLPALWFLGAAMLVAGNVIIGRREEKDGAVVVAAEAVRPSADLTGNERSDLLGEHNEDVELDGAVEAVGKSKTADEDDDDDDILDLGDDLVKPAGSKGI